MVTWPLDLTLGRSLKGREDKRRRPPHAVRVSQANAGAVLAHQRHHHFGEVTEDLALRFRRWQQADASQTVTFHLPKLMRNLLECAHDAGPVNRLGRNESLLARLHVSAMPVVDLHEAFLLRQAEARDVFQVASPVQREKTASTSITSDDHHSPPRGDRRAGMPTTRTHGAIRAVRVMDSACSKK